MDKKSIEVLMINELLGMFSSFGWRSTINFANDQKMNIKIASDEKLFERTMLFFEEFDFK